MFVESAHHFQEEILWRAQSIAHVYQSPIHVVIVFNHIQLLAFESECSHSELPILLQFG